MAGSIALLTIPADGGGNPQEVVIDHARGLLYFVGRTSIRSYRFALETQSPMLSVLGLPNSNIWAADVDPVSGVLVVNRSLPPAGTGGPNAYPLVRFDPATLEVTGSFGSPAIFPGWPTSFWALETVVCVACGTLASGGAVQVGWALMKESEFSGAVGVVRIDNMTQGGFHQDVVSGSVDNRGFICRGASGPSGASVFLTWSTTSPAPTLPVYTVRIAPGAETYNPLSWPATNPYITQATIGTLTAASVDPAWSNLAANSIGYDQHDGNVLMSVYTNDAVATRNYLIKVNAVTGAVMWATPSSGNVQQGLSGSSVRYDTEGVLRTAQYGTVATPDGALAIGGPIGGLNYSLSLFVGSDQASSAFSDSLALYLVVASFNGAAANAPTPVAGTPSSFGTSYAILDGLLPEPAPPPPEPQLAELLDLWLAPTPGFVDLRAQETRRKFIGIDGSTQFLGPDGSRPFATPTPVFLTLDAGKTVEHFADNDGAGEAFVINDGVLTAGTTRPPCGAYTVRAGVLSNVPLGADPLIMLSLSDNGGRTFSLLQKWRSMGKLGHYRHRLRWLKMGKFRQRQIRLEVTDPVRRNIIGVYIDTTQGLE